MTKCVLLWSLFLSMTSAHFGANRLVKRGNTPSTTIKELPRDMVDKIAGSLGGVDTIRFGYSSKSNKQQLGKQMEGKLVFIQSVQKFCDGPTFELLTRRSMAMQPILNLFMDSPACLEAVLRFTKEESFVWPYTTLQLGLSFRLENEQSKDSQLLKTFLELPQTKHLSIKVGTSIGWTKTSPSPQLFLNKDMANKPYSSYLTSQTLQMFPNTPRNGPFPDILYQDSPQKPVTAVTGQFKTLMESPFHYAVIALNPTSSVSNNLELMQAILKNSRYVDIALQGIQDGLAPMDVSHIDVIDKLFSKLKCSQKPIVNIYLSVSKEKKQKVLAFAKKMNNVKSIQFQINTFPLTQIVKKLSGK